MNQGLETFARVYQNEGSILGNVIKGWSYRLGGGDWPLCVNASVNISTRCAER